MIAALVLCSSLASAEDTKKPNKPSVYQVDQCQQVALKGAVGFSDAEKGWTKDTAMLCQTKHSVRVLREWRIEGWGDGEMFVVGR